MHNPLDVMKIRSVKSTDVLTREKSQTHNIFGRNIRIDPGTKKRKDHTGWDLLAPNKSPVYAVAAGTVVRAWRDKSIKNYGTEVELEFHLNGQEYTAFYAHLTDFSVSLFQPVAEGQVIGWTGHSGNAHNLPESQWHLHFELREVHGNRPHLRHNSVDPAILLGSAILMCSVDMPTKNSGHDADGNLEQLLRMR